VCYRANALDATKPTGECVKMVSMGPVSELQEVGEESEGDGARTRNHRIDNPVPACNYPNKTDISQKACTTNAPNEAEATDCRTSSDPDLAHVLKVWPTLPKAIKAGILAMVTASGMEGQL